MQSQPRGVEAWLSELSTMTEIPALPPALQSWLRRFVMSPDFPFLVSYVRTHGDRAGALKLVRELKTLSHNGELREAFSLLAYLRNDRIRDLSGYLKTWLASQELDALLDTAETLLAPLAESPRVVSSTH